MIAAAVRARYFPGGTLELVFPFNQRALDRIKDTIPADYRKFDATQRRWLIAPVWAERAEAIVRDVFGARVQIVADERRRA